MILPDLTPTSVTNLTEARFDFYPNPANGYITVRTEELGGTLRILDISGKLMLNEKMVQPVQRIDLSGIKSGMYFISVEKESTRMTQKLIIR